MTTTTDEKVKSAEEPTVMQNLRIYSGLGVFAERRIGVSFTHEDAIALIAYVDSIKAAAVPAQATPAELPRPWPVGALYYIWDTPDGRGCRVADDGDLWASVDSLPTERRTALLAKLTVSSESDALDREKAKRGHEIEARMKAEEECVRLRDAVRNRESEAIAALAELDESNARVRELESQLAEVRERDAARATEFSQLSDSRGP